jgi:serine/threonine-protein kinase
LANTLGRFHIIREIARSNDIVYEAMDPSQGRKIALKELLMPANLVGNARQERIQRFTREARAAARLKHPNIVRIEDHGQVGTRYYIAMEFLQGQSLRDVLRQRGSLPLQEALRIAVGVAEGLQYAHHNGVVHRDIKPDNVHLEPDGRVVITDFGIARLTFEPTLTADGQIFGTPSYMSPEQVTGKGIDKRSDLFSLGVMLYEMVAGRKPFTGDSVITITYNIMNMEPPPLPGAPPGLDQVIRRAMAKEPARRYSSAAEMLEDLRLIQSGAAPRHAAMPLAAPVPASRPAPRSAPAPAPRPLSSAPAMGAPPMPQPMFGGGGPRPAGPVPGVRPGPVPRPMPAGAMPRGAVPVSLPPSVPAGYAPTPNGYAPPRAPSRRQSGGMDLGWFLGWLGIAVVIGVLIIGIVWAMVVAQDRLRQDTARRASDTTRVSADRAFTTGQYEAALKGYLEVVNSTSGQTQALARRNAAVAAVELAKQHLKNDKADAAKTAAEQALQIIPGYPQGHIALARVHAQQDRVDDAVQEYDRALSSAQTTINSGGADNEVRDAKTALSEARVWKADTLYNDAARLIKSDRDKARVRFEQTIQAAPGTQYERLARDALKSLDSGNAGPRVDDFSNLTPADSGGQPGAPGRPPAGWDPSYQNPFGNQ